jgi:hypothetical protein
VTELKTKKEWAVFVKRIANEFYPNVGSPYFSARLS